jgi:hypothetical protein
VLYPLRLRYGVEEVPVVDAIAHFSQVMEAEAEAEHIMYQLYQLAAGKLIQ